MKKFAAAVTLLGGALLVTQSAFAQSIVPNDLYLGFQNAAGGATEDYIINLGPAANLAGSSSVVDLSSSFSRSDFNEVLGTSSSLMGGVVGGNQNGNATTPYALYATQLRTGGSLDPKTPGSDLSTVAFTYQTDSSAFAALGTLNAPAAGAGVLDTTKSWQNSVENGIQSPNTFWGNSGINPDSPVGPSGILREDLWHTSSPGGFSRHAFQYLGYFTLDLMGSSPKLTFTPMNAPAPLQPAEFKSVNKSVGTVTLTWSTVAGQSYQLQYTTSLAPANWINLGSALTATSAMMTNTDSVGTNSQRFYRLITK